MENSIVIIAVIQPYEEVYKFLIDNQFNEKNILNVPHLYEWYEAQKRQYFEQSIIRYENDEVFYDCGCLNCYTILSFMESCDSIDKIYAFEPDGFNIKNCNGTSSVGTDGNVVIDVVAIDNIANGEKVSFIKMDIEGSELEALKGAKKTIIKYKPKLAISLYHKSEDIIEFLNM